jgi:hypothetical protein
MRDNSYDRTIERNYLQKWRFLIPEYEAVKAGGSDNWLRKKLKRSRPELVLLFRLHFGVLRKLEPFASNAKPYIQRKLVSRAGSARACADRLIDARMGAAPGR